MESLILSARKETHANTSLIPNSNHIQTTSAASTLILRQLQLNAVEENRKRHREHMEKMETTMDLNTQLIKRVLDLLNGGGIIQPGSSPTSQKKTSSMCATTLEKKPSLATR